MQVINADGYIRIIFQHVLNSTLQNFALQRANRTPVRKLKGKRGRTQVTRAPLSGKIYKLQPVAVTEGFLFASVGFYNRRVSKKTDSGTEKPRHRRGIRGGKSAGTPVQFPERAANRLLPRIPRRIDANHHVPIGIPLEKIDEPLDGRPDDLG